MTTTFWQARDFLSCGLCGGLLTFDAVRAASCPHCGGFKRKDKEIQGKETRYAVTNEDIRRELKIEPFVSIESALMEDVHVRRTMINETCPNEACKNPQLEYYIKQMRSADEGDTAFFECPNCGCKFNN